MRMRGFSLRPLIHRPFCSFGDLFFFLPFHSPIAETIFSTVVRTFLKTGPQEIASNTIEFQEGKALRSSPRSVSAFHL
jgi:hypothetical protein